MIAGGDLLGSPAAYPLAVVAGGAEIAVLRLTEADYAQASFLDERLLQSHPAARTDLATLQSAAAILPVAFDAIFHIGHVGSTLIARLLGRSPQIFALREPALLRPLAVGAGAGHPPLGTLLRLYSRTWRAQQRALIKVTSFASELAPAMLTADPGARALLLTLAPEPWLAGILGGEATRAELPAATPARLARLERRLGEVPAVQGTGEMAAAGWASEMLSLLAAAGSAEERVRWLDFDSFLLDPRGELLLLLRWLTGAADRASAGAILGGPDMGRYAKAPEHPFSPGQRGQILAQARAVHGTEIARGLRWLEALSRRHSAVAKALDQARTPA